MFKYKSISIYQIFIIAPAFVAGVLLWSQTTTPEDREVWDYAELDRHFDTDRPSVELAAEEGAIASTSPGPAATGTPAIRPDSPGRPAETVLLDVPFTAQAPLAEWADPRQQDGCEEASALMAVKWARGEELDKKTAKAEILALADHQEKEYGSYVDTSAEDTVKRLIKGYYKHQSASVAHSVSAPGIIAELLKGNLVLAPSQGQRLGNPNFTPPGPERHMLVIRGYDPATDEFIVNDPGTRLGEGYRYKSDVLMYAILDYPTGDHEPIVKEQKNVIVVGK